jgi:hypothetical protein
MITLRVVWPLLLIPSGCRAAEGAAPAEVVCRIEKVVFDSGADEWHTYATLEVDGKRTVRWSVIPPKTWDDVPRKGSFTLERALYDELVDAVASGAFTKSGAIWTLQVSMNNHRAKVLPAVAAVLRLFQKDNWASSLKWFSSSDIPVDFFRRDQPTIDRMLRWDGGIVVGADRFYKVDVDRGMAISVSIPGMESIVDLAMRGESEPVALGRNGRGLVLGVRGAAGWSNWPLPEEVRTSSKRYLLAADENTVVLFGEGRCYRVWGKGAPREIPLKPRPECKFQLMVGGDPHRCFLRDAALYLAHDRGEWGGALLSVKLETGDWSVISDDLPVRELKVDPRGRLWAVEGINHLGHQAGILRVNEDHAWKEFARMGSYDYEITKQQNWNLPVSPLHSVAFDGKGSPHVLAEYAAIARWDGGRWQLATKGWPRQSFNGALYPIGGDFLDIARDKLAVVSMGDAGIALWDLEGDKLTRVRLR